MTTPSGRPRMGEGAYARVLQRAAARLLWHVCPVNTPVSFHEDWRKLHSVVGGDAVVAAQNIDRPDDDHARGPEGEGA